MFFRIKYYRSKHSSKPTIGGNMGLNVVFHRFPLGFECKITKSQNEAAPLSLWSLFNAVLFHEITSIFRESNLEGGGYTVWGGWKEGTIFEALSDTCIAERKEKFEAKVSHAVNEVLRGFYPALKGSPDQYETSIRSMVYTFEAVKEGVRSGLSGFLFGRVCSIPLAVIGCIAQKIIGGISKQAEYDVLEKVSVWNLCLVGPILEELIYRGTVFNAILAIQSIATKYFPHLSILPYLASPSMRVFLSNSVFALMHLSNGGAYLSTIQACQQTILIGCLPMNSLAYETTGSILAPLASHILNNSTSVLLCFSLGLLDKIREN